MHKEKGKSKRHKQKFKHEIYRNLCSTHTAISLRKHLTFPYLWHMHLTQPFQSRLLSLDYHVHSRVLFLSTDFLAIYQKICTLKHHFYTTTKQGGRNLNIHNSKKTWIYTCLDWHTCKLLMIKIKRKGALKCDFYLSKSRARLSRLSLDRLRAGGSSVSLRLNWLWFLDADSWRFSHACR